MEEKETIKSLCEKTGKKHTAIYKLAKKLGRLPTVEEVLTQKRGRPKKY